MKGGDDMDQDLSRCAKCGKEFFPDEDDGSGDFPILRIAEERMVKNKKTGEVYCWECGQVLMKVKEMATK